MQPPPDLRRVGGVLLHPTSLPGRYGIGDLGNHLTVFLDWAAGAGMRLWQVLPLNPTGYGASPYGCLSSFAGNPLLISPEKLLQDGLLTSEEVAQVPHFDDERVDFDRVAPYKFQLLRTSANRFESSARNELQAAFDAFLESPEQQEWLDDYALFMALKESHDGAPWWEWPAALASRESSALDDARQTLEKEIRFWKYAQFLFFRQWAGVRAAVHARGLRIMGDIPIYVAGDSADVWSDRALFQLDEDGQPTVVAGVPPDYFSATGQRWGNPLYRWDVMKSDGFSWWIRRVRANLRFADVIRLDHFRGFAAYWEVPADEPTAVHGRWMAGPGTALFDALREALGDLPLVAEDLGFITQDVHDLRNAVGVPGMKILQFGFGSNDSPHLPHRFDPHTVVYTGTHDNDTARGWFDSAAENEKENIASYLGCNSGDDVAWGLIRAAWTSVAATAIVPAQDILGLGSTARMNTPGEEHDNWTWRLRAGALTRELAEHLHKLALLTGRA